MLCAKARDFAVIHTNNVFNADEMALFFKLLPECTLALKGDKCKGGKRSKERITVLLCCNMTGTEKLKPLVIGKSRRPHAFKHVHSLPAEYCWNTKTWMTAAIFSEWLVRLDRKMRDENRHIALILDNCSAHSKLPKTTHVKVVLLPPNCTSLLQPLDRGIIRSVKSHYRRRMLERILVNINSKVQHPTRIDVRQAIEMLTGAWWSVKHEVIVNCWRNAGFVQTEAANCDEECLGPDEDESLLTAWKNYTSVFDVPETVTATHFVTADDDVTVRPQLTDADICTEVEMEKQPHNAENN